MGLGKAARFCHTWRLRRLSAYGWITLLTMLEYNSDERLQRLIAKRCEMF